MNSEPSAIPAKREIKRPYFLLTTPDGVGHFMKEKKPAVNSVNQALFSRREPLTGYLADARLEANEEAGFSDRKSFSVCYHIDEEIRKSAVPFDTISEALLSALEDAVMRFLGRGGERRFSPHEKTLRESFRVPDPDLEPDCYWMYGPPGERKILILWGCEKRENSSIPLAAEGNRQGKNLLDWLRSKRMGWAGKQREMIRFLRDSRHPLRDYIALPVFDRAGGLHGYTVGDKDYPKSSFRRARHVTARSVDRFEKTATAFYDELSDDRDRLSESQRELRESLKFPDWEKRPDLVLRRGGDFAVVLPDDLKEEECLHLCAHEASGLPPMIENDQGDKVVPSTFLECLRERITPVKLYASAGVAAGLICFVGLGVLYAMSDRTPPQLLEVVSTDEPDSVVAVFDEPVLPRSLAWDKDEDPRFRIRAVTGKVHEVHGAELFDDRTDTVKILLSPPLQDGGEYSLLARDIVDTSWHRNQMQEPQSIMFVWLDREPPALKRVSAEGSNDRELLLFFSKPLEEASATRPVNYRIEGFRILGADFHMEDPSVVRLTAERDPRSAPPGADAGFLHLGEYEIEISGIRDATVSRNPLEDTIRKVFVFEDIVPPRVTSVDASENQWTVTVDFSERLDQASAESTGHYFLAAEDGTVLSVDAAGLAANERSVVLTTEPMYPNIQYTLRVHGVRDASPRRNEMVDPVEYTFNYRGRLDQTPPLIEEIGVADDLLEIVVVFNEQVRVSTAEDHRNYEIPGFSGEIMDVRRLGADNRRFLLRLSGPLPQAESLRMVVSGVKDRVGNVAESASLPFQVPGVIWMDATLQALGAEVLSPTRLRLRFNDRVTADSATRFENWRLPEPYVVERATLDQGRSEVVLELSPENPLQPGTLQIEARNMRMLTDPDSPQASIRFTIHVRLD